MKKAMTLPWLCLALLACHKRKDLPYSYWTMDGENLILMGPRFIMVKLLSSFGALTYSRTASLFIFKILAHFPTLIPY